MFGQKIYEKRSKNVEVSFDFEEKIVWTLYISNVRFFDQKLD